MSATPTLQEQAEAWQAYVAARQRVDETLDMDDGIIAARAWKRFLDLFLDGSEQLPARKVRTKSRRSNVMVFPVHRTRPSAAIFRKPKR